MDMLSRLIILLLFPTFSFGQAELREQANASLQKGIAFFHSINTHGGYVYNVTPDLSLRWGEGPKDAETIEVQPPGTPAVGQSFLRAYRATGDKQALVAAKDAAYALIRGQNKYGGWGHTINFADLSNETVSFDDNQSQSAVSFLMALDHSKRPFQKDDAERGTLERAVPGDGPHQQCGFQSKRGHSLRIHRAERSVGEAVIFV